MACLANQEITTLQSYYTGRAVRQEKLAERATVRKKFKLAESQMAVAQIYKNTIAALEDCKTETKKKAAKAATQIHFLYNQRFGAIFCVNNFVPSCLRKNKGQFSGLKFQTVVFS